MEVSFAQTCYVGDKMDFMFHIKSSTQNLQNIQYSSFIDYVKIIGLEKM